MLVSVITPVYKAEQFLRESVASALACPETGEVILIEDGSPDNSLAVCEELSSQFDQVRLFRHPNGENRGAGESRNLGISKAKFDFIAFLDADDLYTINRFTRSIELLNSTDIDGVYGATGIFFDSYEAKERYAQYKGISIKEVEKTISTVKEGPNSLFDRFLSGYGEFTTDAITLRRSILDSVDWFNVDLKLHQDSELWLRIIYQFNIVGLGREIIAKRRVHDSNRVIRTNHESLSKYNEVLLAFWKGKDVKWEYKKRFYVSYCSHKMRSRTMVKNQLLLKLLLGIYLISNIKKMF